jgi:hypothetical protein
MERIKTWLSMDIPAGWTELLIRTVKVALVAFVVLQLKELIDAGVFDTPATAIDALLIAGGTLVLNAIFMWANPSWSRGQRIYQN